MLTPQNFHRTYPPELMLTTIPNHNTDELSFNNTMDTNFNLITKIKNKHTN